MPTKTKHRSLLHPKFFVSWLIVFTLYLISLLPLGVKQKFGDKLGRTLYGKLNSRRKVTQKNLQVCLPELDESTRNKLASDTFSACAQGLIETTHAWWRNVDPLVENLIITGEEHLIEAKETGRGLLLIGGHFSIFDIALPFFAAQLNQPGYMYRPHNNPVIDRMIERGRRRHYNIQAFDKRQLKNMNQFIKQGGSVWYAPDQDFGRNCRVFAPFFGVPAGCITTPSWIARESNAVVLCVSQYRHPNGQFEIALSPILENFGEDETQDAITWNHYLEQAIRKHPEQYLWLHKRFKTRPEGAASLY